MVLVEKEKWSGKKNKNPLFLFLVVNMDLKGFREKKIRKFT